MTHQRKHLRKSKYGRLFRAGRKLPFKDLEDAVKKGYLKVKWVKSSSILGGQDISIIPTEKGKVLGKMLVRSR